MITRAQLVLGTVQLGLTYGIANRSGKPDYTRALSIINEAWKNGIREFDTAQGYGDSEDTLGRAIHDLGIGNEIRIISKFDPRTDHLRGDLLSDSLERSLQRLGVASLHGMLLHREELLSLWDRGLSRKLLEFVESGKVRKLGISVYTPAAAARALNSEGIDIVQLPTNVLDRRFENAGIFELAREKNKMVYIRSIFLQGLLLLSADEVPDHLSEACTFLAELTRISEEYGLAPKDIAVGYIKKTMPHACVIFGAETQNQVIENIRAWHKELPETVCERIRGVFNDVAEDILNPARWTS